jgi:hypothetical protein
VLSSSRCGRSATSWRLVPFSHRSASRIFVVRPGCIPSLMVTQDSDHQFDGGEKQAGLRPLPRPQLQGFSSFGLRQRSAPSGGLPPRGSVTLFFPSVWGRKASTSPAEASFSHAGEGELLLPGQGAVFRPSPGRRSRLVRAGHVQVFLTPIAVPEGCPARRTPRGRCSCSGAASARAGVRTCRCTLGRPTLADAVLVDRWTPPSVLRWWQLEKSSSPTRSSAPSALRASGSLALIACPRPSSGDVGEGLVAAASALRSSLLLFGRPERRSLSLLQEWAAVSRLEFVVPRASWYGGCSYPWERNRSPVCNGT